jgi:hypothetical protein
MPPALRIAGNPASQRYVLKATRGSRRQRFEDRFRPVHKGESS